MGFLNKIILLIIIGVTGSVVYYVGIPYIQSLQDSTLAERIAIEVGSNDKDPILVSIGDTRILIDLAVTNFEKEKGLGGRFFLSDNNGLLFVYEKEGFPAIWMKNMIFPIDIVWLDSQFRIVHVEKNISPNTYPSAFRTDLPAKYVLELNAGFLDLHDIHIGNELKLVEQEDLSV